MVAKRDNSRLFGRVVSGGDDGHAAFAGFKTDVLLHFAGHKDIGTGTLGMHPIAICRAADYSDFPDGTFWIAKGPGGLIKTTGSELRELLQGHCRRQDADATSGLLDGFV